MIFISHRGNLTGKAGEGWENHPDYINEALNRKFDVEVDVWFINNSFFLGHDNPQYEIQESFLRNNHLWCHAKNKEALDIMINRGLHCFWHNADDYTLTSKGYIWCYPGSPALHNSIILEFGDKISDFYYDNLNIVKGICSDNIYQIKTQFENKFIISNL